MLSQTDRLYSLLKDCEPHRTDEIVKIVYGNEHLGLARVGARIYDVHRKYGVEIEGWKDKDNPSLYWYRIDPILNAQISQENAPITRVNDQQALFNLPPIEPKFQMPD